VKTASDNAFYTTVAAIVLLKEMVRRLRNLEASIGSGWVVFTVVPKSFFLGKSIFDTCMEY
jgi:hypothetical protein